MYAINDLNVIEVNECLREGEFGLCGRLHKSSARHTSSLAIVPTIGLGTILTLDAPSPASDGTTPDKVKAVIVNRNLDIFLLTSIDLEVAISWNGVFEEALANCPRLNTLCTLEAISVTPALCVLA